MDFRSASKLPSQKVTCDPISLNSANIISCLITREGQEDQKLMRIDLLGGTFELVRGSKGHVTGSYMINLLLPLDQFDSHRRNSGGIPELGALGDYGDALQTVSEQIVSLAGKKSWATREALRRKKGLC